MVSSSGLDRNCHAVLCRNAIDHDYFLRVSTDDGEFVDYDLVHDELPIVIERGAMAAIYRTPGRQFLDHDPRVLGLDDGLHEP